MSLPNKKQLHKHKRGARKALDTLDALEKNTDDFTSEANPEESEPKKTAGHKNTKSTKKKQDALKDRKKDFTSSRVKGGENLEQADQEKAGYNQGQSIELEEEKKGNRNTPEQEVNLSGKKQKKEKSAVTFNMDLEDSKQPIQSVPKEQPAPSPDKKPAEKVENPSNSNNPKTNEMDITEINSEITDINLSDELLEDTQKDKYLSFKLGDEDYGISIEYVTEIIVMQRITEVPNTPEFVEGVINLRGKVIPVINIRTRFGLDSREYDDRTCVVVVNHDEVTVGMIVDTVNEVVDIPENSVDPPPQKHSGIDNNYISGLGKIGNEVKILLDVKNVLFVEELIDEGISSSE